MYTRRTITRRCCSGLGGGVAALLWLAPASLGQVSFSGPTNYAVGTEPIAVAVADVSSETHRPDHADVVTANDDGSSVSVLLGDGDRRRCWLPLTSATTRL